MAILLAASGQFHLECFFGNMSFSIMGTTEIAKLLDEDIRIQDLPPTMNNVPDDVLCVALTYIGIGEMCSTAQVNGRWHGAFNNAEAEIILNILQRHGPVLRSFSDYDTCSAREDRDGASMGNEHEILKQFLRRAFTVMTVSSQGNSLAPPSMLLGQRKPFALPTVLPPSLFTDISSVIDVEYRTGNSQRGSSFMSPYIDGSFDCSINLTHKFLSNPSIALCFSRNGKNTTFLRTNIVLKRFPNGMIFSTYRADIKEFEWHPFEDRQHIHIITRGTLRYHHRLRNPDQAKMVLNFRFDLMLGHDKFIDLSKLELSWILEAMFDGGAIISHE